MPAGKPSRGGSGGGNGVTLAQVNSRIAAAQRVIYPNADGSWPDPETNSQKLLKTDEDLFEAVFDASSDTTATWTAYTAADYLAAYALADRPNPAATSSQNKRIFETDRGLWFVSNSIGEGRWRWQNTSPPALWLDQYEDEDEATHHVEEDGNIAEWGGTVYVASDVVEGTSRTDTWYWQPVDNTISEDGGLDQSAVDARIRALVNAIALVGAINRWPEARIDTAIVRATQLGAAIAPFLNQTAIQALIDASITTGLADYRTETQIEALIAAQNHIKDRGRWIAGNEYVVRDMVTTPTATYLNIQTAAANTAAVTEPGVGSQWTAYWFRIGWADGPPNALVGVSIDDHEITFTRESAQNPVVITLPSAAEPADRQSGGYTNWNHWTPLTTPAFSLANDVPDRSGANNGVEIQTGSFFTRRLFNGMVPIRAGDPFDLYFEGSFRTQTFARVVMGLTFKYTLFAGVDMKQFTTSNEIIFLVQSNSEVTTSLNWFNAHGLLRPGIVTPTDGGSTYTWVAADFMSSIPVIVDVELRAYGVGNYPARATGNLKEFTAHNLSMTFDQIGFAVTPATKPSVASFDVTGDDGPAVGSIAAKVYTYRGAVSQPAHASAVRIVGFEGMEANPSSVASLATIAEADWPDFSGSVTIPAGVSLDSAGDVYTIRLEVYGEGQDLTDSPVAYHDYRITAHATTSLAHFGRVLYVEGETEAQRAAAIVFASDDIESIGASGVDGKTWTVSGIPDDGNHYLPYWLVPASATQPVNWTTGGININNFFAATVDVTLGGVDYKAYLFANSNRQDHGYNGATIVTGV